MPTLTLTLPRTTSDRLRAVADQIEREPWTHDQTEWVGVDPDSELSYVPVSHQLGLGRMCGTTGCIAGWAVTLTPIELLPRVPVDLDGDEDWTASGRDVLGLDDDLASWLFVEVSNSRRDEIPGWLRALAEIPEGERTWDEAVFRNIVPQEYLEREWLS